MAAVYRDASGAVISEAEFFRRARAIIDRHGANSPQLVAFQNRWRSAASGLTPSNPATSAPAIAPPKLLDPGQAYVPPHLTPEQQQGRIADTYNNADARTIADSDWLAVTDPSVTAAERAKIIDAYNHGIRSRTEDLGARGLSARGYSAADVWDVERTRVLAEDDLANAIRLADNRHAATISNLNDRQTANDVNYAAMEGANMHAAVAPTYAAQPPAPAAPPKPAVGNAPNAIPGQPSGPKPGDHYVWVPQDNRWAYTGPSPGKNYRWNRDHWEVIG